MPATAGRVRMPANNRVHSSAALQTHGIWQSAIGYDPYAPNKDDSKSTSQQKPENSEPDGENAYASFQGLLALARITGSNADEARGSCKKCGRVSHLTFQCHNFLSMKDANKDEDLDATQASVAAGLGKLKSKGGKMNNKTAAESSEESSEEEDESQSSDSEVDLEIERIIAARNGKVTGSKGKLSRKKKVSDTGEGEKRGRSKKRRSRKTAGSDSDDENEDGKKITKEKRRKRHESSEEDEKPHHRHRKSRKDKRRRRSHRRSGDSVGSDESDRRHKRKSRREVSYSDSDVSSSDDSPAGKGKKQSEKRSRKHQAQEDV